MEGLEKSGIHRNYQVQSWDGPRMTKPQQMRLIHIGNEYKLPCAIWYHLKVIIESNPRMLDYNFQFCIQHFAKQSPVVMKRALLRLEKYSLDKFKNIWDLFHVCVLHAIHEK
ncbi:uncharacterized protein LOC144447085 [Glandiceps talaboti]